MRVILKDEALILAPEDESERAAFAVWRQAKAGHVFALDSGPAKGGALRDLGLREAACREPLNIVFDQTEPRWQPISNLARTPFILRGRSYASIEGFWQGLKFQSEDERKRVAALWGKEAKRAARGMPERERFLYEGESYVTGGAGHRRLMLQACRAKFAQDESARTALLATGDRPLTHRVRQDSKTIPGVLLADIWMRLRIALRDGGGIEEEPVPPAAEPDGRILFFERDRADFGFLSHFHPVPIELDGERWPTVEHYFQAQKSFDAAYRAEIRAAATPGDAKQLAADPDSGRPAAQRSWFLQTGHTPRADWAEVQLEVMRRADFAKFVQHPDLGDRLLATGTAEIVEDSPFDAFWGTGRDGSGLNWAGRVLMEVRDHLRAERAAVAGTVS